MLILLGVVVAIGLSLWMAFGEEGAAPDGSLMDDLAAGAEEADAAGTTEETATEPEPTETATEDKDFDRPANWRKTMSEFESLLPEAKREVFRRRLEQPERWGNSVDSARKEAKEAKEQHDAFQKDLESVADQFEGGTDILHNRGPQHFLRMLKDYTDKAIKADKAPVTDAEPADPRDVALKQTQDRLDKLEKQLQNEAEETKRQAAAKSFYDELIPAVKTALHKSFNVKDDPKAFDAFADVAESMFYAEASRNPKATASGAVEAAAKLLTLLRDASPVKSPRRPEGQLVTTGPAAPVKLGSYDEMLEGLSGDLAEGARQAPE